MAEYNVIFVTLVATRCWRITTLTSENHLSWLSIRPIR